MAPTLSFFKHSKPQFHDKAPPTSPFVQMPTVFVVPPEEDHSPSWCYFDAAEAPPLKLVLSTPPDVDFLDNALSALHTESHPPVFHRHAAGSPSRNIMPMKAGETRSITDVLMNSEHSCTDDEFDFHLELESEPEAVTGARGTGGHNAAEDSVVVEVVKLRRREGEHVVIPPAKHSRSLKSRASKILCSLKNVGKGPTRSRLHLPGASIPTSVAGDGPPPRENTPAASRRSSIILSQLFTSSTTLESSNSISSSENQGSQHDSLVSASEQRTPGSVSSPPYSHPSTVSNSPIPDFLDPSSVSCQNSIRQTSRSPSPTSIQAFPNKPRFSTMNLQWLFSFSSSDHYSEPSGSGSTTPTSTSMSRDSSGPSAASSLNLDTPTEGSPPFSLHLPPHLHHEGDDKHFLVNSNHQSAAGPASAPEDLSFELRLDSLHFETLSFDISKF